jgi:hypothetical protein
MNKNPLEMINLLSNELRFLRQLVHLQRAEIQALREYTISRITELGRLDRAIEFQEMSQLTRETYDRNIERLEVSHPALAADIDMRDKLNKEQQDMWYFPSEYPPKKDAPPDGGQSHP